MSGMSDTHVVLEVRHLGAWNADGSGKVFKKVILNKSDINYVATDDKGRTLMSYLSGHEVSTYELNIKLEQLFELL